MNLSKSYEWFQPESVNERIHIIGCGSVGSTIAELLSRFGLTKISLYDFDTVEPHNIVNQMFTSKDIGKLKVNAVADMLKDINPEIGTDLKTFDKGYMTQKLSGYVFLCVDNIELRRQIAESYKHSNYIKAMFDVRTRLTDAQHYAADWSDKKMVENFLRSMDFSHDEATEETPVSACNIALSVAPTVRLICNYAVSNFINFSLGKDIKKFIQVDAFEFLLDAL